MTSAVITGVGTAVTGVWRSHAVLDESDPDCSPEAPQQFKKMRSSSSLNSLRMSLRKRLPLKSVQSNVNISEDPTWESLQMNQKTSAVRKITRSAKNSIDNVYQKFQRSRQPREECLVMTPGKVSEGEDNDYTGTSHTPKRSAARTTITPRRTPRSTSKRTLRGPRTPEAGDSAVRAVKTRGTRRQLVRMAALKSPFASPNTVNRRRQFDEDLDCVSKGLRRLKRLSQAFDNAIGRDDRVQAVEHYKTVMTMGYSSTKSNISGRVNRASIRKHTERVQQAVSSWTDAALSNIRKAP